MSDPADQQLTEVVRSALERCGRLAVEVATLGDDDDLYTAGLGSHAAVSVLLDIEDELGCEMSPSVLTRSTFASIASIRRALRADRPASVTGIVRDTSA